MTISFASVAIYSMTGHSLSPFEIEYDTLQKQAGSPDGEYTAKLLYRENVAMTYGYYRVTVGAKNGPTNHEVAQVADEGLENVAWSDRRTLVVTYTASNKSKDDNAQFVSKQSTWRDIKIVYRQGIAPRRIQ